MVIQFGDTFVWDGPEGNPKNNFMGVAVNTAAVVQNPKTQPTKSHYMDLHSNGMVPVIPPYATGEGDPPVDQFGVAQTHIRTGLWCSGGIVFGEVNGDIAKGYCFFEKTHIVSCLLLSVGHRLMFEKGERRIYSGHLAHGIRDC